MTIRDLSTIDVTYTTPDGTTELVAVVVDWEPESLRLAQLAVKLTGMRWYGEQRSPYRIEVACYGDQPPESAVALTRRAGGTTTREGAEPTAGRPGTFAPNAAGELDWPAIHAANAGLFAREHGLDASVDSLRRLDELLADAYARASQDRDEDGDVPEDGDLAILAGAYASEVMLAAFGGEWTPPDERSGLPDLRIRLGRDGHLVVAAAGKVRKFLRDGPADAVHPLATLVSERL